VDGTEDPEEEVKVESGAQENGINNKADQKESSQSEEHIKGIPGFWLEALKHHDAFSEMITERDEEALNYLRDVRANPVQGENASFALEFHFNPNPYFDNAIITKTYHLLEKETGQVLFDRVESTEINWKDGKNLTIKLVTKQQGGKKSARGGKRGGRGGQPTRTVTVEEPCDSFFTFFNPEANWTDDIDEEEKEALLEDDYDLGLEFKDEIIPNAVMWYTGEAAEQLGAYLNDDDDDEEDDDEDDDEDQEEDDEDQEEEDRPKSEAGAHPQNQQSKPECNQQ